MEDREMTMLYRVDAGRTKYAETWSLQKKLVELRSQHKIPDTIILTEHEPVITMGRGTSKTNLLIPIESLGERRIDLFEIERGGDITFHGPGQLVAYPIIDLNMRGRDLHKYLRDLENVVILTLESFGLTAGIRKGMTGVWVEDHKLAAIGVAVSRWISYHGLALNVNTDLDYFKLINPCGITQYPVGSISQIKGEAQDMNNVSDLLIESFAKIFGCRVEKIEDVESLITEEAEVLRNEGL